MTKYTRKLYWLMWWIPLHIFLYYLYYKQCSNHLKSYSIWHTCVCVFIHVFACICACPCVWVGEIRVQQIFNSNFGIWKHISNNNDYKQYLQLWVICQCSESGFIKVNNVKVFQYVYLSSWYKFLGSVKVIILSHFLKEI